MYEVEYKIELTADERAKLVELFTKKGFEPKGMVTQHDFYIEAQKSPFGGYNLKRYRDEGKKVIFTQKIWEDCNGEKVRKEIEHEVERAELEREVAAHPETIKIKKDRTSFSGEYTPKDLNGILVKTLKIHIDMDSIKYDHSPSIRYFIEAEVLSEDKEGIKALKQQLIEFLKESLGKTELTESPGMFTMAVEKR